MWEEAMKKRVSQALRSSKTCGGQKTGGLKKEVILCKTFGFVSKENTY